MTFTKDDARDELRVHVARPTKYEQGDTVYGVAPIDPENLPATGKLFDDYSREIELHKRHIEKIRHSPFYDPDTDYLAVYEATISSVGAADIPGHQVVSPDEEVLVTLTDIEFHAFVPPGETVDIESLPD